MTRQLVALKGKQAFQRIVESLPNGVVAVNRNGAILFINEQVERYFGYSRAELIGQPIELLVPERFQRQHPQYRADFFAHPSARPLGVGRDLFGRRKDGSEFPIEIGLTPVQTDKELIVLGSVIDITGRKRMEQTLRTLNETLQERTDQLAHANTDMNGVTKALRKANEHLELMSTIDPLTELLNRRGLQQALSEERRRARRDGGGSCAILMDLDDFKPINDALGLTVGDQVLVAVARQLKAAVRVTDYVARIGGDEFLILLPETRSAEGILVAEKLRVAISEIPRTLASLPSLTASLGVVQLSEEVVSIEEALTQLQSALQRSKQAGKDQVACGVQPGVSRRSTDATKHAALLLTLRRGHRFRVVRQPILSLEDMQPVGYEFLSRLAVNGYEMPDEFFRVARDADLMTLVDRHCFTTCLTASTLLPPGARCHINLFPSTLIDVSMARLLEDLPMHGRVRTYCIELSEQHILGDPSYLIESVKAWQRSGVLIALDDVSFRRSALETLLLLRPQIVKIDQSCVRGIGRDPSRSRLFKRLLHVIDSQGAEAVAKGIESSEDLEVLKAFGVKRGQGFLLGAPQA